jgi:hypothetical protein
MWGIGRRVRVRVRMVAIVVVVVRGGAWAWGVLGGGEWVSRGGSGLKLRAGDLIRLGSAVTG